MTDESMHARTVSELVWRCLRTNVHIWSAAGADAATIRYKPPLAIRMGLNKIRKSRHRNNFIKIYVDIGRTSINDRNSLINQKRFFVYAIIGSHDFTENAIFSENSGDEYNSFFITYKWFSCTRRKLRHEWAWLLASDVNSGIVTSFA